MFAGFKPVAAEVKEAVIRPVTRRREEYQEEKRAVDAWSVKEVCTDEEEEYEDWRGVRWYEEEWQPAITKS